MTDLSKTDPEWLDREDARLEAKLNQLEDWMKELETLANKAIADGDKVKARELEKLIDQWGFELDEFKYPELYEALDEQKTKPQ